MQTACFIHLPMKCGKKRRVIFEFISSLKKTAFVTYGKQAKSLVDKRQSLEFWQHLKNL